MLQKGFIMSRYQLCEINAQNAYEIHFLEEHLLIFNFFNPSHFFSVYQAIFNIQKVAHS